MCAQMFSWKVETRPFTFLHSVYIIKPLCLCVRLDIDTYIEIKFIVSPHYLHSFYKTKYTCAHVHFEEIHQLWGRLFCGSNDHKHWFVSKAHHCTLRCPRSIFLCVEKPKNETLKLKLQNCIYSKAQWPKWHANVTSWCCHHKKRPS